MNDNNFSTLLSATVSGWISFKVFQQLFREYTRNKTYKNKKYYNLHDCINNVKSINKRVAIIGTGISGIEAMKTCLSEGIEPICFEIDSDIGGFWRYKDDINKRSVYKSTHIDTDRDINSFGDFPMDSSQPLLISNQGLFKYLKKNCIEFNLMDKIRFNTKVIWVTVKDKNASSNHTWIIKWQKINPDTSEIIEEGQDEFDGVLVCTGRHNLGGWIPPFPSLNKFTKPYIHSSQYKYPEKHQLEGKKVVVVGVGNSGIDIVTEVSQYAKDTILVARSGSWIFKAKHGEEVFSQEIFDKYTAYLLGKLPWWVVSGFIEGRMKKSQVILNKHGMEPKHRFFQQHMLVSGLTDPKHTLHDELENGNIRITKGIKEFTENGIIFEDNKEENDIDFVIFATGYKQGVSFIDPEIIDFRHERKGNDIPLYKFIFPLHRNNYSSLGFINFLQSATFMCAELQSQYFTKVLKGDIILPSIEQQKDEVYTIRQTLCAQYMDRQQLRCQAGLSMKYYDDLAKGIGCYPSIKKLIKERPTAIWHAWFTPWQPLQYRLVGPGRLENAEQAIEDLYQSRFFGICPLTGKKRKGAKNRSGIIGISLTCVTQIVIGGLILYWWMKGANMGDSIQDKLNENLKYLETDKIEHAMEFGIDSKDVIELKQE